MSICRIAVLGIVVKIFVQCALLFLWRLPSGLHTKFVVNACSHYIEALLLLESSRMSVNKFVVSNELAVVLSL